jgi:uncharacterized protein YukE
MLDAPTHRDPAAAQAQAARLRAAAEAVAQLQQRLDLRVDTLAFEGPAALRFRTAMADRSRRARRLADELQQTADRVAHS